QPRLLDRDLLERVDVLRAGHQDRSELTGGDQLLDRAMSGLRTGHVAVRELVQLAELLLERHLREQRGHPIGRAFGRLAAAAGARRERRELTAQSPAPGA